MKKYYIKKKGTQTMNIRKKALIMILKELEQGSDYMLENLYNHLGWNSEELMKYCEKNKLDRNSFSEIILVLLDSTPLITDEVLKHGIEEGIDSLLTYIIEVMWEKNLTQGEIDSHKNCLLRI